MEFLKRKHFSLWIILYLNFWSGSVIGLQGVPTWICLGIKSPFIEFKAEIEILANTSVSLNITKDDQALMHEQGLQKLGTFIKPIDLRNSTTGFVKSNLTKKVQFDTNSRRKGVTENPIAEEMNRKNIELIEEEGDSSESLINAMNADRKFIVPMALKNPAQEAKKEAQSEFSTNIDDLKNHILMLQNMTKSNKNFQDKFVVFPSIQRERNSTKTMTTTSATPRRLNYQQSRAYDEQPRHRPKAETDPEEFPKENIAIIPQVLLLNDQTAPDDDMANANVNEDHKDYRVTYTRRRNYRRTTTSTTTTTTVRPSRRTPKRQRSGGGEKRKKNRRNQNCRNLDTPRCQRQRRRQQQQQQQQMSITFNSTLSGYAMSSDSLRSQDRGDFKLSRSIRSHSRRNAGGGVKSGYGSIYETAGSGTITRDFIIPVGNVINNNQTLAYKENIDVNPDLCYKVDGLTYGQQKLCVLHTNIMPAISRGARSAVQECKHQFKNRRWNCSTTEDSTVFGPMSSIGSPEMAFINALAAATVTSFIARACRDGQLASCGCSRSSRPKQLHDDWTWGGCGDDLEFAYKFSQSFVDIREKERKRGTRGLISVPPRNKMDEKILSEFGNNTPSTTLELTTNRTLNGTTTVESSSNVTLNTNSSQVVESPSSIFKPEDLLELNEKITKEILNSKLQEKEMLALKEKISREILNSKVFNLDQAGIVYGGRKQHQRTGSGPSSSSSMGRIKSGGSQKARSLMNMHNNEAGRRAVIKKTRITCKCHGVSGSCSLITCWQQLSSIREIGDYLREKYDEATEVKLNKRGRLQVKDPRYKVPTAHDLVYLDESPDWCRNSRQLQWPGTHGRICNKTSSGLDGCAILCCGRGYNTKNIVVRERCNCKFHWCCQVKCEICVKTLEEHTCK